MRFAQEGRYSTQKGALFPLKSRFVSHIYAYYIFSRLTESELDHPKFLYYIMFANIFWFQNIRLDPQRNPLQNFSLPAGFHREPVTLKCNALKVTGACELQNLWYD